MGTRTLWACLAVWSVGCGGGDDDGFGPPADFAGSFTLALTNGENGCAFASWTVGATASAVPFTITQDDADLTGSVGGLAGPFLDLVLGGHVFGGQGSGSHATMTLYGTRSATEGSCGWTVNATVELDIDGDVVSGSIDYAAATNGSPDCGARSGCVSTQEFNGTRPP